MRAAEARSQSTARRGLRAARRAATDGVWRAGASAGAGMSVGASVTLCAGGREHRVPRARRVTARRAAWRARLCRRRCGRGRAPCRRVLRGLRGSSSRAPPFRVVARMDCRRRAPLGLFRACISRVRSMKRGGEAVDRAADRTAIYRTRTRTRDKARQKHPVPAPTRRLNAGGRSRCGCRARGTRASCRPGIAGGAKSDGRRLCVDDGMCVAGACAAWEATACALVAFASLIRA
ncbi:Uncharacterised protein [Burkholderia pseudomallei]|nr:Uncharacterised protein [Burkholderia pseudomallei]CAJ3020013.1 Uncharacterised protein [Burkholderia pseudomallei]CAJ3070061.1 Uncharacterised protein [Burkholderia pseudomallei]VBC85431.1 Uncharacterised protein [Burkholderia pseudomallei]VBE65372.1 Uncharacterised protein [Burkholderia pseudomallei]